MRQLLLGDVQLLGQDLSVTCGLIEHQDEVTVLEYVLDLPG